MDTEMKMPPIAPGGDTMKVVKWLAKNGQRVERGQVLLEVETDKAVMEVGSDICGVLVKVLVRVGQKVTIGQPIAIFDMKPAVLT